MSGSPRLSRTHVAPDPKRPDRLMNEYDEKAVSFIDKGTGEILTFAYVGMEFAAWAPGWCFLRLGAPMLAEPPSLIPTTARVVEDAAPTSGTPADVACTHHDEPKPAPGLQCLDCGCVFSPSGQWLRRGGRCAWRPGTDPE